MSETMAAPRLNYDVFETALGWVAVVGSHRGIRRSSLPERSPDDALAAVAADIEGAAHDPQAVSAARRAIVSYCAGASGDLSEIAIDVNGATPFFEKAWAACRTVPRGETRTYSWLAEAAGNSRAARGAGQAMARNPFPLLVPCHRIVGSDGGLHGFGGGIGLPMKRRLLGLENALPVTA